MTTPRERASIISSFTKWQNRSEGVEHQTFARSEDLVTVTKELERAVELLKGCANWYWAVETGEGPAPPTPSKLMIEMQEFLREVG